MHHGLDRRIPGDKVSGRPVVYPASRSGDQAVDLRLDRARGSAGLTPSFIHPLATRGGAKHSVATQARNRSRPTALDQG